MAVRLEQVGLLFTSSILLLAQNSLYSTGWLNVRGQARIEGYVTNTKAFAEAGPPGSGAGILLEWSDDPGGGSPVTRTKVIAQDGGDPTTGKFVYPIDVRNLSRFVRISFKTPGGAGNTSPQAEVYARPDSGGPQT